MTPSGQSRYESAFRAALEAQDLPRAGEALRDYIAWFASASRALPEIESAMSLFDWGIRLTSERRVQLAEELIRLRRLVEAYTLPKQVQTWRVIG